MRDRERYVSNIYIYIYTYIPGFLGPSIRATGPLIVGTKAKMEGLGGSRYTLKSLSSLWDLATNEHRLYL